MKIAFLYNVRHLYPDPNDPRSQLETDFDDQKTIDTIILHLKECKYDVLPIEANEAAYSTLQKNKNTIDLAFNYAMGLHGKDRYCQIPAILEMLQIPYTGPSPLTEALVLNKFVMQDVLRAHDIPVLESVLCTQINDIEKCNVLTFPLMVKPVGQGSSAGITHKSVVNNQEELEAQVKSILSTFSEPVLIQPFITGREFSVPLLGNPPEVLPAVEPVFSKLPKGYLPFDSLEVKWIFEEEAAKDHHLKCPAEITTEVKDKLHETVLKVWDALSLQDFCRIDLRYDTNGKLFVLDVNSPPGIMPPECSETSYLPMSARSIGLDYNFLLKKIIQSAVDRYK